MTVDELIGRILEFSHDEDAPDTALKSKALSWLNHAYAELMDELSPFLEDAQFVQEKVTTDLAGVAVLAQAPRKILQVKHVETGKVVPQITAREAVNLASDKLLQGFLADGRGVKLCPASDDVIEVSYVPVVARLQAAGAETDLLLPSAYHAGLVWGALVWGAFYERGLNTQGEITLFQQKWAEAKNATKLALSSNPASALRVVSYNF